MREEHRPLIAIVGETASGKTAFSIALAQALGGPDCVEIISADAFQLYRGMDIGTAKITREDMRGIRHHQLDVLDIHEEASVAVYQRCARENIQNIKAVGKIPIIVGGSGLYVSAVVDELNFPGHDVNERDRLNKVFEERGLNALREELLRIDPRSAAIIDLNNPRRVIRALEVVHITGESYASKFPRHTSHYNDVKFFGIRRPKEALNHDINLRVEGMFRDGLLEETTTLLSKGLRASPTAKRATGYGQAMKVIDGELMIDEAIADTQLMTRRLAKKQRTWFKADPRIKWLDFEGSASDVRKEFDSCARELVKGT